MKRIYLTVLIFVAAFLSCFLSCCVRDPGSENGANADKLQILTDREGLDGIRVDENNFPDPVFRNWLKDPSNINGYGSDSFLTYEEISDIKSITISGTSGSTIKDMTGIDFFTELNSLSIPYNSLTSLDFESNGKLTYLN